MSDPSSDRHANGRFVKGHPGGPGRPRNPVSTAAQELDRLGVEVARELLRVIVERARTGNLKAAEMVLQRVWPVRRNRPIELDIAPEDPELPYLLGEYADLAEAMVTGHITPQDAQIVTRVFRTLQDQMKRAVEMPAPDNGESPPKSA
jgi:hypothetical protein